MFASLMGDGLYRRMGFKELRKLKFGWEDEEKDEMESGMVVLFPMVWGM